MKRLTALDGWSTIAHTLSRQRSPFFKPEGIYMHCPARELSVFVISVAILSGCSESAPTVPPTPTVTSVAVSGSNSVNVGSTSNLTATANRSDGTTENVTGVATWQTSNAAVASVSPTGLVMALTPGSSVISAAFGGQTGQLSLQVNAVDNIQRVTLTWTNVVVIGTCDENSLFEDSVDGEFFFAWHLLRDGGSERIFATGPAPRTKGSHAINAPTQFNRNVTRGDDFRVTFEATEFDGLLGADPRMNHSISRTHTWVNASGEWSGARSLTIGSGSCGVTLNYAISSARQ